MKKRICPTWLRQGVRCVSSHEPLSFIRRRGGAGVNVEEMREREYSEETVKRLAERGLDMIVVHGYKGLGLEFEKQELERTRRVAEACRKHGLKLGTYCQIASIFPETFFRDYPQGRDWIQRDFRGEPYYYNTQTFRVFPCYRNREYREYYKGVIRYLVEDIGTNFLHFDNLLESIEPHSCHCPHCRAAFTAFLRRRYGGDDEAAQRRRVERFGFDCLDVIEPPVYSAWQHPGEMEIINDPVVQEWTWFRCETIADFMGEMSAYATHLNSEVGVEANVGYFPGPNRIRSCATFVPWFASSLDLVFNEDPQGLPRITADGVVATNVRAFKIARGQGIGCLGGGNREGRDGLQMTAAERLAFSPDFSWWMGSPAAFAHDDRLEFPYVEFYRANRDLYHETDVIADVTLLRSFPTLANNSHVPNLMACVAEQSLIEARIPWTAVSDEVLDDLGSVRVLLMPQVECVSETAAERLMAFVRAGGSLVMTGDTGCFDEWRRPRPQPVLAGLLGESVWPKRAHKCKVGQGRAVYLPRIALRTPDHLPAAHPWYAPIDTRYWKPAKNHRALIAALRWAAGGQFSAEVSAPTGVLCEFVRQGEARRPIIHFVNLRKNTARNVTVSLSGGLAAGARGVEVRGPDLRRPRTIRIAGTAARANFQVPAFKRYLAAVILPERPERQRADRTSAQSP